MAGFQINFVILKQAYLGAGFNFFNSEIGNLTLLLLSLSLSAGPTPLSCKTMVNKYSEILGFVQALYSSYYFILLQLLTHNFVLLIYKSQFKSILPHFLWIGPLGQFSPRVTISICGVYVCLSVCDYSKQLFPEVVETYGWKAYRFWHAMTQF